MKERAQRRQRGVHYSEMEEIWIFEKWLWQQHLVGAVFRGWDEQATQG